MPMTMTTKHAATYLGVSRSTLLRLEQRGLIEPSRTPGGHRRYTVEALCELQKRLQQERQAEDAAYPLCNIEIGE